MSRIEELQHLIHEAIEAGNYSAEPAELYAPIAYTMQLGGKRLRPTLTLLACDMFGGDLEDALHPALAIEIFHNFTLLHDDIMDRSPLRRNQPTVWKKWDSNIAILSGDTMLIMAYQYLMKTRCDCLVEILNLFNTTAAEVCQGQQYDMNFETQAEVSVGEYINMIRLKTAVLLASSLKTGAIVAGAGDENAEKLYHFGENIGIAFQLMDDYLDAFGDQEIFGKQTGNDILTNKRTYLYLKALEVADEQTRKEFFKAFAINKPDEKVAEVMRIFRKLKVDELSRDAIVYYNREAYEILDAVNIEQSRKSDLIAFAEMLTRRQN